MGWSRKARRKNRFLKKGGKLGQVVGALKKRNYGYILTDFISCTCFYSLLMLLASATFKGGKYSQFLGSGENLILGDLITPLETMLI